MKSQGGSIVISPVTDATCMLLWKPLGCIIDGLLALIHVTGFVHAGVGSIFRCSIAAGHPEIQPGIP